jgi:hypothetical protein
MLTGRVYVYELRPPAGLLFILQIIGLYKHAEPRCNDIDKENPKNSEKTRPSAILTTTIPIRTDRGANPGLLRESSKT